MPIDKTEKVDVLEKKASAEKSSSDGEVDLSEGSETLEKPENKSNKKTIGIIIAILIVIALVCGGVYMATASGQEQSQEVPVGTVSEEVDTEAHVVLEAELGELDVLSDISFAIYEKDNEKTSILKVANAAINEYIEINSVKLKEGENYRLYLTETPILSDGSLLIIEKAVEFTFEEKEHFDIKVKLTRIAPEKMNKTQLEETATALEALGKTELAANLRSMIEAAPGESEAVSETTPDETTTSNSSSGNTGTNNGSGVSGGGGNSGNSNNTGGASNSEPNAGKTWYPEEGYQAVDVEGHYESVPQTIYVDQCYCGAILPAGVPYSTHAKANGGPEAGHGGYWTGVPQTTYVDVWVEPTYKWVVTRPAGWY